MNTFMRTQDRVKVQNWLASDASDTCEHVREDRALAYAVRGESDSFGPLTRFVLCRECDERAEEEAESTPVVCHDCHKSMPQRETRWWRSYDFYAPQGDEPLVICDTCWVAPKHVHRRDEDRRAAEEEDASYEAARQRRAW